MMHQVLPIGLLKVLGMLLLSVCHFSTLSAQETASAATAIDSDASDRPPELIERGLHRLMGEVLKAEPSSSSADTTNSDPRADSSTDSSDQLL
ncbi:MAG: hypothetical protein ACK43N_18065, partial [Pirellulaceae bacterium]